ncbi:MAG: hypothetical protein TREMPRED_004891 [Tremellales sp. Tagirdzhanova-0007]|nr:MAG: hypothetical protein TREMPRED_004891 [Tremellales sp. Tagirdzhanova-0007]
MPTAAPVVVTEPLLGRNTLPRLWIYICKVWIWIAAGSLIMPFIVWLFILGENLHVYRDTENSYIGNDAAVYGGDPNAGYVDLTNIPKHLAGVVFAAAFDISMMIFIFVSFCADLFWKFEWCKQVLEMLFAVGLWTGAKITEIEYFCLIANAFLKLFIVAATGAEAFTGLNSGINTVDTPLFCLWAVLILLGSIPFTVIASMFIIQHNKRLDYDEAEKNSPSQSRRNQSGSNKAPVSVPAPKATQRPNQLTETTPKPNTPETTFNPTTPNSVQANLDAQNFGWGGCCSSRYTFEENDSPELRRKKMERRMRSRVGIVAGANGGVMGPGVAGGGMSL